MNTAGQEGVVVYPYADMQLMMTAKIVMIWTIFEILIKNYNLGFYIITVY